jgi:hypothetical protein
MSCPDKRLIRNSVARKDIYLSAYYITDFLKWDARRIPSNRIVPKPT